METKTITEKLEALEKEHKEHAAAVNSALTDHAKAINSLLGDIQTLRDLGSMLRQSAEDAQVKINQLAQMIQAQNAEAQAAKKESADGKAE